MAGQEASKAASGIGVESGDLVAGVVVMSDHRSLCSHSRGNSRHIQPRGRHRRTLRPSHSSTSLHRMVVAVAAPGVQVAARVAVQAAAWAGWRANAR